MKSKEKKVLEIPYLYQQNLKINYTYNDKISPFLTHMSTEFHRARGNLLQMMIDKDITDLEKKRLFQLNQHVNLFEKKNQEPPNESDNEIKMDSIQKIHHKVQVRDLLKRKQDEVDENKKKDL